MGRVSEEAIKKLTEFMSLLPEEARNKCALCNETLTHIVKMAEIETGAGPATVTRVLAEKINENAADGDKVSGNALNQRVRHNEGLKCQSDKIEPAEDGEEKKGEDEVLARPQTKSAYGGHSVDMSLRNGALYFSTIAISTLEKIMVDDPYREQAFDEVIEWITKNRRIL